MCGIFAYLGKAPVDLESVTNEFHKISHRGPDNHSFALPKPEIFMGFHRLAINDLSDKGNQPFVHKTLGRTVTMVCNGEIYNYAELIEEHKLDVSSHSDCEVIIPLYEKYGFKKTIEMLDGVFACILHDSKEDRVFVARDPIGVRALYIGATDGSYAICSELKGIHTICKDVISFPPGFIWNNKTNKYAQYTNVMSRTLPLTQSQVDNAQTTHKFHTNVDIIKLNIKSKLINAVKKRLISDRPIGCLLSGGLDSSLIASILSKLIQTNKANQKKLKTFSVGLDGSEDLKYAKIVSEFLGTDHTEVILSEKEMLAGISDTIYQLETYDTTTIRAGTPMFLLSKYIKENDPDDTTVIYTGEGSDEASGSYLYFHSAPGPQEFYNETLRLMRDLYYYDVLRCDKSIAGAGLEARVPFLDLNFLEYYLNVDPGLKMPNKQEKIEKYLLRSAFDDNTFLPDEVLWRVKEGMSDGVSSKTRGWFEIIQEHAESLYSDDMFAASQKQYVFNPPLFKEALWFRDVFNQHFSNNTHDARAKTIPYYWLPKWSGDITEPSARVLDVYK